MWPGWAKMREHESDGRRCGRGGVRNRRVETKIEHIGLESQYGTRDWIKIRKEAAQKTEKELIAKSMSKIHEKRA